MSGVISHFVITVSFCVGELILCVATLALVRPRWDYFTSVALDLEDGRFGWAGRGRILTSIILGFLALVFGIGATARALS